MAYTLEDLRTIELARKSGQLRVQLGDKVVQYQNGADLRQAEADIKADLIAQGIAVPGVTTGFRPRAWRIAASKGL
jgi:hypothetical protein